MNIYNIQSAIFRGSLGNDRGTFFFFLYCTSFSDNTKYCLNWTSVFCRRTKNCLKIGTKITRNLAPCENIPQLLPQYSLPSPVAATYKKCWSCKEVQLWRNYRKGVLALYCINFDCIVGLTLSTVTLSNTLSCESKARVKYHSENYSYTVKIQ